MTTLDDIQKGLIKVDGRKIRKPGGLTQEDINDKIAEYQKASYLAQQRNFRENYFTFENFKQGGKIKRHQLGAKLQDIVYKQFNKQNEDKTNSNQSNLFLNQSTTQQLGYIPQYSLSSEQRARTNYVEKHSPDWLQPLSSRLETPEQPTPETPPDFAKAAKEMRSGVNVDNINYIYSRLREEGYTKDQASVIAATTIFESGADPYIQQHGGGPGYGLIQ
jgi:hypothetical protein